jgi:tetratricopeptide (TPR) repeat protein
VVVAEQKKEELKLEASDDKDAKARSAAEQARKTLTDAYNAGKDAIAAGKFDDAVVSLTKAAALDPKQGAVWSSLADAYMAIARGQKTADSAATYQKAYDAFAKAIELAPNNAGIYNNFALALAASGKMDEAKQNLEKAIEIDPAGAGKYQYNLDYAQESPFRALASLGW